MYSVLDKDMIEIGIVPYIPRTKRGFPPTVALAEIVNAVLYKLKTGVQWNQLPVKALFLHNEQEQVGKEKPPGYFFCFCTT